MTKKQIYAALDARFTENGEIDPDDLTDAACIILQNNYSLHFDMLGTAVSDDSLLVSALVEYVTDCGTHGGRIDTRKLVRDWIIDRENGWYTQILSDIREERARLRKETMEG